MCLLLLFFFNDTATTEIYTLSLHDALPIYLHPDPVRGSRPRRRPRHHELGTISLIEPTMTTLVVDLEAVTFTDSTCIGALTDRKSTRLNSSHQIISYAVFCLNKKNHHQCVT